MLHSCSQNHSFHLVSESPWPFFCSVGALTLTFGLATYFHGGEGASRLLELSFILLTLSSSAWWRDIIRESTIECYHTKKVTRGLSMGMLLFIISESMFFFAFFWSYFYFSFNPHFNLGSVWPPMYLAILNPFEIPLLNTCLLITSGASLTWCHHSILIKDKFEAILALVLTISLGLIFTACQFFEYQTAPFSISDGVYGSIFFLTTGFHGFHVFVGTVFLIVCLYRLYFDHFTCDQHLGFEMAAWYWHFVDCVWLGLYVIFYVWASL